MTDKQTGGPAFPWVKPASEDNGEVICLGMTLRDYFAAKALSFCLKNCFTTEGAVERSYEIADAMLKAREL